MSVNSNENKTKQGRTTGLTHCYLTAHARTTSHSLKLRLHLQQAAKTIRNKCPLKWNQATMTFKTLTNSCLSAVPLPPPPHRLPLPGSNPTRSILRVFPHCTFQQLSVFDPGQSSSTSFSVVERLPPPSCSPTT